MNFYGENPTYFRVFYNHLWNLTKKKIIIKGVRLQTRTLTLCVFIFLI